VTSVGVQIRKYLAALPPDARRKLKAIRLQILTVAPDAVEHFSYGIPGFRVDGQPLVWYAAFKNHLSMYPLTPGIRRGLGAELDRYETAKGTIRFPLTKPPSAALVKKLVKARVTEIRKKSKT
jgi:uncharacterized protein YdhG (YjbR/CyaY superfamily)